MKHTIIEKVIMRIISNSQLMRLNLLAISSLDSSLVLLAHLICAFHQSLNLMFPDHSFHKLLHNPSRKFQT